MRVVAQKQGCSQGRPYARSVSSAILQVNVKHELCVDELLFHRRVLSPQCVHHQGVVHVRVNSTTRRRMAVVKAGAEDGDKDKDNVYSGLGLKTSRRSLSVQQRWRAFQFHMKEQREKLATLPPMLQLFNLMAALRKYIKPVLDAVEKCKATWENMGEMYEQYLAEETRSRWTWEKKNRKELELFGRIPPYIFGMSY